MEKNLSLQGDTNLKNQKNDQKIHIISFTAAGFSLSERLKSLLIQENFTEENITLSSVKNEKLSDWTKSNFKKGNFLIFIGAAGIAVRAVSPFVKDKTSDAAVIVLDEKGQFVIPILSGHIGGANSFSKKIACLLAATPVITTASDVNGLPAIDEYARENNLAINDMSLAKAFAAEMLEEKHPKFSISIYAKDDILNLIPRCVILGIGCKKGKNPEELKNFVQKVLKDNNIDYRSLEKIASIDLKKGEAAIISLSEALKIPFVTFSANELNEITQKVSHSDFVSDITGTDNVCERAVFACGATRLLLPKSAEKGMTLALGIREVSFPEF